MSIKYAVLGLIAEEPRHGYAVRAAFEERLGDFWELNYGQVYQVLTALQQESLITGTDEQVGRRPRRTVYAISAKGRDALRAWLAKPPSATKPFRDDFYVRLLFITEDSGTLLSEILTRRANACERRVAELLDQRRMQDRTSPEKVARWLFTEAAVLHAEADLKAAALCRRVLMETLAGASASATVTTSRPKPEGADRSRKLRARG
jgi:DNA-binding PadR family transcriptional regulator